MVLGLREWSEVRPHTVQMRARHPRTSCGRCRTDDRKLLLSCNRKLSQRYKGQRTHRTSAGRSCWTCKYPKGTLWGVFKHGHKGLRTFCVHVLDITRGFSYARCLPNEWCCDIRKERGS